MHCRVSTTTLDVIGRAAYKVGLEPLIVVLQEKALLFGLVAALTPLIHLALQHVAVARHLTQLLSRRLCSWWR